MKIPNSDPTRTTDRASLTFYSDQFSRKNKFKLKRKARMMHKRMMSSKREKAINKFENAMLSIMALEHKFFDK